MLTATEIQMIAKATAAEMAATVKPRWLEIKEACGYARVSRNTLMNYINEGHVYAFKRTGKWIVDRESIDDFFTAQKAPKRRIKMNDYVRWYEHGRWVYEHRVVMERRIGRKLKSHEHTHHRDGNPKNNALLNLEITNANDHMRTHQPAKLKSKKICSVKGCRVRHHAKGYCRKHYSAVVNGWPIK